MIESDGYYDEDGNILLGDFAGKKELYSGDKVYLDENVFEAACRRIDYLLDEFPNLYVSVSGGKDSSFLLQLIKERARLKDKLPIRAFFIDSEVIYKATDTHVRDLFSDPDIEAYWICLPMTVYTGFSSEHTHWTCWDPETPELWIRPMPDLDCVIHKDNIPKSWSGWYYDGIQQREFKDKFNGWMRDHFGRGRTTVNVLGIRAEESMNRYLSIKKRKTESMYKGNPWTVLKMKNNYNAYPIYDFEITDIWTGIGKEGYRHNKLYDLMWQKGYSLKTSRGDHIDGQASRLEFFKYIEPETWNKIVRRVPGINFGNKYSKSTLLGQFNIKKPEGFTWRNFINFLLNTIPTEQANMYMSNINKFYIYWEGTRGFSREDFPDSRPPKGDPLWVDNVTGRVRSRLPSWQRIARMIMKNDLAGHTLMLKETVIGVKGELEALKERSK